MNGSFDPDLNLIYWGVGNPNPDYYDENRPGDNLYTDSIVALDADSGELRWHYQFTPHDVNDWDSNHMPVLANIEWEGQPRRVVMVGNRNGFFLCSRSRYRRILTWRTLHSNHMGKRNRRGWKAGGSK